MKEGNTYDNDVIPQWDQAPAEPRAAVPLKKASVPERVSKKPEPKAT